MISGININRLRNKRRFRRGAKDDENEEIGEVTKNLTYNIIIPEDGSTDILSSVNLSNYPSRKGGFCGEKLLIWLVASWNEDASYLDQADWEPNIFNCEIKRINCQPNSQHVSTFAIQQEQVEYKSKVTKGSACIPLVVELPHEPTTSPARLVIWKNDYSTKVAKTEISILLPISFIHTFKVDVDMIAINLDFSSSTCEVNSFDLRFAPQFKTGLSDYEEAFALRRVPESSKYILSVASSDYIRLLNDLKFSLSVLWNNNRMISHFIIDLKFPSFPIGLLWEVPKLQKLKQTPLAVEVTNTSGNTIDVELELDDRPCIPLVKSFLIQNLSPNEKRSVDVPCVPCVSGVHELTYQVKIGTALYKPLFKTMVLIE